MAITDEGIRALNQDEHNEDAHAKRVVIRAQDPASGNFVNIAATDNGDGTFSLKTAAAAGSGGLTNAELRATPVPVSGTVAATQSGTWTVQPGNTANTTAWKVDGSAVTQPVSLASVPSHAVTNAGTFAVQNTASLVAGTNNIGDMDIETFENSADVTMQSAAVAVGNGTVLTTTGYGTAVIQVTGTFSGTITFEGSLNGTDYVSLSAVQVGAGTIATTATTTGIYRMSPVGMTNIRARISAYTSGSITAVGRATNAPYGIKVVSISGGVASGASATTTGTTVARFTALTNVAQAVKATTGTLYSYHLSNQANPAQDLYVHFYNVVAASVTVGTTTPSRSFFLPGGAVIDTPYSVPMAFGTAISVAVSTTATGGTAPTNVIYAHAEFA